MIKLNNFEENFKNEDTTEIKRIEFKKLYEELYKNVNPDVDINDQVAFSNALHNNREYFTRYAILNKQLVINSVLQEIMNIANNGSGEQKVSPFNRVRINSVVKDLNSFHEELLKKGIDTSGYEVGLFSLDEIRTYLYNSVGIKCKSMSDMYDYEINQRFGNVKLDYGELIIQGINPACVTHPEEKAYIDEEYLKENNLFKDYILKGNIFGKEVLSKNNKKIK